jgi:hypothetical protein
MDSHFGIFNSTVTTKKQRPVHFHSSTCIAGASSLNSAKLVCLSLVLISSFSRPISFVQIHVDAYILTL